jgi:magnesium transporter
MTKSLKSFIRSVGQAPGFMQSEEEPILNDKISISIIEYSENEFQEQNHVSVKQCVERLDTPAITWIIVNSVLDTATIAYLGKQFKIHPLALEDIMTTGHRPKLDTYDNQVFIICRSLFYDQQTHKLNDEQVSIIFGSNYVICFLESDKDIFAPVKDRIRKPQSRFRKQKADYLAYALLDVIVDYYLVILEQIDMDLDQLEDELMHTPNAKTLQKTRLAKRQMIILRKAIWPMRDVISRFQQLDDALVSTNTQLYLRDVYDHTVQTIDMVEGFRDVVSGMVDVYLSNINIRMNEIMKVLTIMSTIFVPLTFIASIYGMNFEHMPELHYRWAYPIVLMTMLVIALAMIYLFHRKKWI